MKLAETLGAIEKFLSSKYLLGLRLIQFDVMLVFNSHALIEPESSQALYFLCVINPTAAAS